MDTFLTVTKQSSNRALDMPASYVATLKDGEEIFIESYGRKFVWDTTFPSGTATVDGESFRPLCWSANGAFIADLRGSAKYWRQSAWFISTSGDDENDGLTSATPLKTDGEIQRRWGIGRPRISTSTTISYAQSPTTQSALTCEVLSGGSITFVGTPTVSKTGTVITAVQSQVRTAGAEAAWAVTGSGLGASDVGKLLVRSSDGAYASILKDEGSGKIRISPLGTYNTANGNFSTATPQVNDVVEVWDVANTSISLARIDIVYSSQTPFGGANRTQFDSLKLDGGSSAAGTLRGTPFYYARCVLNNVKLAGIGEQSSTSHFVRGGLVTGSSGVSVRSGQVFFSQVGVLNSTISNANGSTAAFTSDCYFQNSTCISTGGGFVSSQGIASFDVAASDTAIQVTLGANWAQVGSVPDWGTSNAGHSINIQSTGLYSYATKPTSNSGLGAGREAKVGGTDKLYSAVPFIEPANNAALVLTA